MKRITSRTNTTIKQVAELSSARNRALVHLYSAEGLRTCSTLLAYPRVKLHQLFVTESMVAQAQQLVSEELITAVTEPVMEKISQTSSASGMLGVFHVPQQPSDITGPGLILAQVRDPGNVGTLIRSAAAFGMKSVILVESADVWSPKVVQATAGTMGSLDIFVLSWQELCARIDKKRLCALVVRGGKEPTALDLSDSFLIVGNESHGIPAPWLSECGHLVTVAMPGNVESLNASVAGSIGLYEMGLSFIRSLQE